MSLKKNLAYNLALNFLNILFPIITVPYISRVLGLKNVGIVSFVNSYVSYFSLFAALGIIYYGVREIAKLKGNLEKTSKLFSELFRINIISTLIVTILYICTVFFVPMLYKDRILLLIAGAALYLTPISIDWYFQGLENFRIITIRSLVIKVASIIGLFLFVKQSDDVIVYVALTAFSRVGANFWNIFYAIKQGLKISWKKLNTRQHIKPMLIFFAANIAVSVFIMLDVLMLGFLSNYEQVGLFTSPNKIIMIILVAFTAINTVLLPRLSYNKNNKDEDTNNILLQNTFDFMSFIIIPAATGLFLSSSRFVPLFFGNEFLGSIIPMQILSFKVIVIMINSFFATNVLIALGYESKFLRAVVLTAIISFVLNWIFIPRFGAVGAAATSVVAEGFEILLNLFFVYKLTKIRVKWTEMYRSILFTLPIILIYFLLEKWILNPIVFLTVFISTSCFTYLFLQITINKNKLLIQQIQYLKNRKK
jgi:O-antigen/teichoic acid export membrane protein